MRRASHSRSRPPSGTSVACSPRRHRAVRRESRIDFAATRRLVHRDVIVFPSIQPQYLTDFRREGVKMPR